MEIANIENINLRERFINISNNLLAEQLEKEQQVSLLFFFCYFCDIHKNNLFHLSIIVLKLISLYKD